MTKLSGPGPVFAFELLTDIAALADLRGAVGVRGRATGGPGGGLVGGRGAGPAVDPRAGGGGSAVLPRAGGHAARAGPAGRPGGDGRGVLPRPGAGDVGATAGHRPDGRRDRPGQARGAARAAGGHGPLRRAVPGAGGAARRDRPGLGRRPAPGHARGGRAGMYPGADAVGLGDDADRGGAGDLCDLARRDPPPPDLVGAPRERGRPLAAPRLDGGDQPRAARLLAGTDARRGEPGGAVVVLRALPGPLGRPGRGRGLAPAAGRRPRAGPGAAAGRPRAARPVAARPVARRQPGPVARVARPPADARGAGPLAALRRAGGRLHRGGRLADGAAPQRRPGAAPQRAPGGGRDAPAEHLGGVGAGRGAGPRQPRRPPRHPAADAVGGLGQVVGDVPRWCRCWPSPRAWPRPPSRGTTATGRGWPSSPAWSSPTGRR